MTSTIPATARAAALVGYGEPLELMDVQVPDRLEPGALLVRTAAATICASDVHLWEGERGDVMSLMFVAAAEGRLLPRDAVKRMPETPRSRASVATILEEGFDPSAATVAR